MNNYTINSIRKAVWWIKFVIVLIPLAIISVFADRLSWWLGDLTKEIDDYLEDNNYYKQDFNK